MIGTLILSELLMLVVFRKVLRADDGEYVVEMTYGDDK
jgi:hypothetical protein